MISKIVIRTKKMALFFFFFDTIAVKGKCLKVGFVVFLFLGKQIVRVNVLQTNFAVKVQVVSAYIVELMFLSAYILYFCVLY